MHLTIHYRTLLRSWLGSAVLFAAVSACSRPDRADTGSTQDQTGAATTVDTAAGADTQANAADTAVSNADTAAERQRVAQGTTDKPTPVGAPAPDTGVSGYQAMDQDTAPAVSTDTASPEMAGAAQAGGETDRSVSDTVQVGDSTEIGKTGERLEPTASSQEANADTLAGQTESDRVRPPEDSTETLGAVTTGDTAAMTSDTAVTGSGEMARDTNTSVAQGDTIAEVEVDTGAAIQAQVDTGTTQQQTEVAAEAPADTAVVVGDSTEVGKTGERLEPNQASAEANADTLAVETERVRPPEDSTEVLGNVTTEQEQANQRQDQVSEQEVEVAADEAPAAAAGAQTSGEMLTGAAAVAQVTREGQRCTVMEGEESEQEIRWDLAESPATMNPCGTGTMTLPRIQTEK